MFSFSVIVISIVLSQTLSFNIPSSSGSGGSGGISLIDRFPVDDFRQSDTSEFNNDQSTVPSCDRIRWNVRQAHPTDNRKYFICRDEDNYDVYTCPPGGIFDPMEKVCLDLCQQKNPCLNQGQCIILPDLQLQCVCRRDWTGERCEMPLSTCASNPCGPMGECRMLKALDFSQDYVCICNNQKSYGRNCQQTVPNPCLSSTEQFHPFAFSRRTYINCDDEWIFFQPCNALLYWNQEEKRCDRSLPDILRTPFVHINQQQQKPLELTPLFRIKFTQWQDSMNEFENDRNRFLSMQGNDRMEQEPTMMSPTGQSQEIKMPENQLPQQQNFQTFSQRLPTQTRPNTMPTNQRVLPQLQLPKNQPELVTMETTTTTTTTTPPPPRVFRLQGFAGRKFDEPSSQWKTKENNPMQTSTDLKTSFVNQPLSRQEPSTMATRQLGQVPSSFPMLQNMQFGSNVQQPIRNDQMFTSFSEPTINNDMPSGMIRHSLVGWKSNQQGSSNQATEKSPMNDMPRFQPRSWKS